MKLPIIQSLWIGDALSNMEKLCIQSFIDHGHEFHLYTYGDIGGIPAGAIVKDGNEILPSMELFSGTKQTPSNLSDYFRFALLYKKGGWWVDMDAVCLRPFDMPDENILPRLIGTYHTSNPIRFAAGNSLMKTMMELCKNRLAENRNKRKPMHHGELGFTDFSKVSLAMQMQHLANHNYHFNMSIGSGAFDAFNGNCHRDLKFGNNVYSLHFGNRNLGKSGFDKNAIYPTESVYEKLKVKHNIVNATDAKRISASDMNQFEKELQLRKIEKQKRRERNANIAKWVKFTVAGVGIYWLISKLIK